MSWINFARIGKVVALLAFVLPWLVVSCNATPIVSATGLEMVTGSVKALSEQAPQDSSPHLWAVAGLVLIALGLVLSFVLKPVRNAAAAAGGAAAAALVILAIGMFLTIGGIKTKMAEETGEQAASAPASADNPFGGDFEASMRDAMAQAIKVETKFGYWLTLVALLGASGAAFMAFSGRVSPLAGIKLATVAAPAPADPDAAFWDSIDKNDQAALLEYLQRFPQGRFVALARMRLDEGSPPAA